MKYSRKERLEAAKAVVEQSGEKLSVIAESLGMGKTTLYRWLTEDEEFCGLVKELTDRALVKEQPKIDRALLAVAQDKGHRNQVAAAKLLAQRGGRTEVGHRDKGFEDFVKKLGQREAEELEFWRETGRWPDEGELEIHEETGTIQ